MTRPFGPTILMTLLVACLACNTPPMYHSRAEAFLKRQGVDPATIKRLVEQHPLSGQEIDVLSRFQDVPTLHLVGSHPSTPVPILARLARHHSEEIRWGAATNPNTPLDLLLQLRAVGKYSTMNEYLVRNPALPQGLIHEMIRGKEAQLVSVAMNPNCPLVLMQEIVAHGEDLEKSWLAFNRSIPPEIMARLAQDPSPAVARMLSSNPTYLKWVSSQGTKP